jgi:hypothetical protein
MTEPKVQCGITHYAGCPCHEAAREKRLREYETAYQALRAQLTAASNEIKRLVYDVPNDLAVKLEQAQRERDELRRYKVAALSELLVARERLGPAGYQIISEVAKLRAAVRDLAGALERAVKLAEEMKEAGYGIGTPDSWVNALTRHAQLLTELKSREG